ncbi:YbaB/EbfC family nucleoid-associated protein [Mycobacterium lacus]|uniref:DNA-binding protein n=1 Tax=Mycobacterium lacus TaxID=169765 RepID=A0A1X1XQM8_9MYCO|nr:YbaB/EbfC family nucleoid-associated protein [Mycobacterium lacus]MCV7123614.1 YbaB/EbfC family nucleoid-associated protein [Mycobacterium lacus]ORW01153.1 DNA-binding protein [Mycobacterium lacus]BBX98859.1 DNA-binding protein [Mycobacterium lacus]
MTIEMHPQVAEVLQQMRRVQSALEDERHRTDTASYTGTDQAKTVEVTLDWRHWLTGLNIEDGLLRLGAEEVAQRVNEALGNARATATAALEAEQQRLIASLADIVGELRKGLGLNSGSAK